MDYVKSFLTYLVTDKNSSKHTVGGYERDIQEFFSFEGTPDNPCVVEASHIRAYIMDLGVLGRARSTINRKLCALKTFYKYLKDIEQVIAISPAEKVKCGKKEKSLPKAASQGDVITLLQTASESRLKDRVVLELLYGLGLRASELVSLDIRDINFEEGFIHIHGKGMKERMNPIHENGIALIRAYMKRYKISSGWLFPRRDDKSRPMSREAVNRIVTRIKADAGLQDQPITPHTFRHSYATHMLDNGCDMALVQEYLGHEDIATTRIYAHVSKTNKKETFKKFHPLAHTI